MKRQVLMMAGLLLTSVAMAQTQKGNGILSGNVYVDYSEQIVPRNNNLSVLHPTRLDDTWIPSFTFTTGHFCANNWLVGLSVLGASTLRRQNEDSSLTQMRHYTSYSITAIPFVRRYWQVNSIYLFAGAGMSVNVNSRKQPSVDANGHTIEDGQNTSSFGVNPRLEAGVNYFLTNRLGLQLIASASSLPLSTASLSAGLVYWTGSDRHANPQEERTNSQTEQGRWVLEGNFSVNTQKDKLAENGGRATNQMSMHIYSLNPSVGFFVRKNSLIGTSVPVTYSSTDQTSSSPGNSVWSIGISPYYQHYWTSTHLTPYTRINVGYTMIASKTNTTQVYNANNLNGGVTIGLAYMAGQRFIIETSLVSASAVYMAYHKSDAGHFYTSWKAGISAGLTGNFAVRYVLQ